MSKRTVSVERGVRVVTNPRRGGDCEGDFAKQAGHFLHEIAEKRDHEKHELQVLNQRFSSYVERVRALEALNRKLLADIDDLKNKWGLDSGKIKAQMEPELHRLRELIDEQTRLKACAEVKAKRAESDALHFKHLMDLAMESFNHDKNKINNLQHLLEHTAQDMEYLTHQLSDLANQADKYLDEQRRLSEQLKHIKDDLDNEIVTRVTRQNEVQTLEEQIAFLKAVHEQEVAELSRLQSITGFDPTQFYRKELERAIRDIRADFEQLNSEQRHELEEWYRIKIEEAECQVARELEAQRNAANGTEDLAHLRDAYAANKRELAELQQRLLHLQAHLRELEECLEVTKRHNLAALDDKHREIQCLREKIAEIMQNYDELMNRKTSLEFEINTYRRLLECEETRIIKTPAGAGGGGNNVRGGVIGAVVSGGTGGGNLGSTSVTISTSSVIGGLVRPK